MFEKYTEDLYYEFIESALDLRKSLLPAGGHGEELSLTLSIYLGKFGKTSGEKYYGTVP